jgi:hypothetical protein
MITLLILLIILANILITLFVIFITALFIRLILRLQAALLSIASFSPKASLGLPHLVELLLTANMVIVFEDLILLVTSMLIFQFLDHLIGLLLTLGVF